MRRKLLPLSLGFYFLISPLAFAAGDPQVEFFSPQGTAKTVRQVSVRFSEAMVPLGDPRGFIEPFEVVCSEKGNGRWADGRNWVFDFERDLPAGIRCEFRLKPDVRSLSGKEMVGQKIFSFSTGGPSIRFSIPHEGEQSLDEEQVFILALDAEPDDSSVLQNVTFSVEGIESHAGIRIIEGNERKEILKTRFGNRKPPEFPLLLIQCTQRFPSDSKVSLIWGKGVMSKTEVTGGQDQILRFQTRKPFSAEFHCERENPRADCIPLLPMTLSFSAPISKDEANKIVLKSADGKTWRQKPLEDDEAGYVSFPGPFPEKTNFTVELPLGLKDDAERPLTNADKFPLSIRTDSYPPLAKFAARFGILELKADPQLPVTLRNLEPEVKARVVRIDKGEGLTGKIMGKILNIPVGRGEQVQAWLRRVASASRDRSILAEEKQAKEFKVPKPMGSRAFEVVGMPLKNPGLYVVELESAFLGTALLSPPQSMYVPTAVLVTNLSVHFKWGRESSLVWVTTLDKGEPVKDATVTIRDCQENTLWIGKTDAQGLTRVEISLPSLDRLPRCDYNTDHYDGPQMGALNSLWSGLFIMASTPDDMSFVHSSWDEGIEPWRFQLPFEYDSEAVVAHTIFDRALFRAGETVHMKHLLRRHTTKGFSVAPSSRVPNRVLVKHYGSEEKFEFPITWDRSGVAETVWNIPKEAKLGSYEVILIKASDRKRGAGPVDAAEGQERQPSWTSGRFRVEEFRIPLTKGTLQPPADPLVKPQEIPFDLSVQYLAGGGAAFLPVKFRHEIKSRSVAPFEGFDEFIFGNGSVKEGLVRRGEPLESEEEEGESERRGTPPPATDLTLDRYGTVRTTLSNLPEIEEPKELLAELEFRDPNGEVQTVSSKIPLWHARTLVGIKPDSWAMSKESFKFHTAVVDLTGKPVEGVRVNVDLLERKTYTHRKRLVGGFYAYEHSTEIKKVGSLCEGTTDSKGLLICEVRSPVSGNVILQADIRDDRGNRSAAHRDVWIAGKEEWWFEVGDHDRIDLLPERKRYEPGEKATFQVRMPFREATALVTVEREGVMEAWVQKLSGKNPVLEVPIKGNYAPNVYVSALVVRGRVAGVQPTALVDLGKPAYKLGIAEIQVGWKAHELKVSVSSARKVYRVREKAKVRIRVRTADGRIPPPGSEVAVAAVDEGLLELMPNRSWELLSAMMGRRAYDVRTATAQMQVIGKRHFGLKSLPQGGGGGRQPTREMFDTLLLWKARVPLDLEGEASVDIPLNDSVTSFKVVAVATGGTGLFGTGATSIQSTQNLMILSGLPPLVREGDQFKAGFTLRNTTAGSMEVEFSAKVEGLRNQPKPMVVFLASGEAKEIGWDVMAPIGVNKLQWELEASEHGSPEKDRIKISQRVTPVVPVSVFQGTSYIVSVKRENEQISSFVKTAS